MKTYKLTFDQSMSRAGDLVVVAGQAPQGPAPSE